MHKLDAPIVQLDRTSCSLEIRRKIQGIGEVRVMLIKLDEQCYSIIARAIKAANDNYEPDCFMFAFGMADEAAFKASTWTEAPHNRELK